MSRDPVADAVSSEIWKTIANEGGLPSLPPQELAILVEAIAAGIAAGLRSHNPQQSEHKTDSSESFEPLNEGLFGL